MKKIITGALVLALILAASGCSLPGTTPASSSGTPSTPSESVTAPDTTTTAPSGKPASEESPSESPASDGIMSDFTATDLDGNTVDQSIFSEYQLTMVNVWGTFCGPCISEMPELGSLNRDYADKGFQIVGIVSDASDGEDVYKDVVNTANDIIGQTGADYLHILPSTDIIDAFLKQVMYVPTTIFVDKNGNQVGEQYVGAKSYEEWASVADALLEKAA